MVGLGGLAAVAGVAPAPSNTVLLGKVPREVRFPRRFPPAAAPVAVSFVSPLRGYVATAGGSLLSTADAGGAWKLVHAGLRFDALDFVSGRIGFGLAHSTLYRSDDGGRSWQLLHRFAAGRPAGPGRAAISFADARNGWAAPLAQFFYRTRDGGRSWSPVRFGCDFYLAGLSFVDVDHGVVVCGGQPATIMQQREYFSTEDAGEHWLKFKDGVFTGHATSIDYVSASVGFLSAERSGIERVGDGQRVLESDDLDSVSSESWADERHGFAALVRAGLLRTTDGGRSWRRVYP